MLFVSLLYGVATLNSDGGNTTTDGLRLIVGDLGQIQVYSEGQPQFFTFGSDPGPTGKTDIDNGIYLAVGGTIIGPRHTNFDTYINNVTEWTSVSAATGTTTGSGTATLDLRHGTDYQMHISYDYDQLTRFITLTWRLTVTNYSQPVKVYVAYDSLLKGNDFGPSVYAAGPPQLIGVYSDDGAASTYEALRFRSGLAWAGYYAGRNNCMFFRWLDAPACSPGVAIAEAGNFGAFVAPDSQDNGFGVQWNITGNGVYTSSADLIFTPYRPELRGAIGATSFASGTTVPLVFTLENTPKNERHSGLGFVSQLPTGLTVANSTVSNTCGGSALDAGGGALNAGDTGVRLNGALLPTGTATCTTTYNVTATNTTANPIVINFGPATMTSVTAMSNDVAPQSVTVWPTPPVVTLDAPTGIGSALDQAYPVAGNCSNNGGVVNIGLGAINTTAACASGRFSKAVDASGLADGVYALSASQTNAGGSDSDSANVRKQTAVTLTKAFGAGTIPNGGVTTLVFTLSNGPSGLQQGGLSFTDTFLAALSLANAATSTTCATATRTDTGNGVSVSNTSFGGASCTVTFNVTASATVTNGASEMGVTAPLSNGVTTQTLTVTPAPHVVRVETTTPDGVYSVGDIIDITLVLSTNVMETTLTLALSSGAMVIVSCVASACSGSYTVSAGENIGFLDVTTISGTIDDGSATNSTLAPGENLSAAHAIGVDTIAPDAPSLAATRARAIGTGEPGTTVTVSDGGVTLCASAVALDGTFACDYTLDGHSHSVTATVADAAGNTSAPSEAVAFVEAIPPAPLVASPGEGAVNPTQVSGSAAPGSVVTVRDGQATICSVTVDASGAFTCAIDITIDGTHTITATAAFPDGPSGAASAPITITITGGGRGGAAQQVMDENSVGDFAGDLKTKKKAGCGCGAAPSWAEWLLVFGVLVSRRAMRNARTTD